MIVVCLVCKKTIKTIEPLDSNDHTDTYCEECFRAAMAKLIERRLERLKARTGT